MDDRPKKRRRMIVSQVVLQTQYMLLADYYYKYIYKVPCYDSFFTGYMWVQQVLNARSGIRCINAFRMEQHVFRHLCDELELKYGMSISKNMTVLEKVGIFLYTMALGISVRDVCERFQRSSDTISRVIHEVLEAIVGRSHGFQGLAHDIIKPKDRNFPYIPEKIANDDRYNSYFESCIGCIDGTHIDACIPRSEQFPYRGRKNLCTFNVMAVCDFDMHFTFISAGWESSAHDARVFDHALSTPAFNFPHPPPGRYYVVDKGYPDRQGYLVPYPKTRYHHAQFQTQAPEHAREAFNKSHSSLRGCIERSFGVLKKRWKILRTMPSYEISTQIDIIIACFALHNFILKHSYEEDEYFQELEENPEAYLGSNTSEEEGEEANQGGMKDLRDAIALKIWNDRNY